MPNIEVGTTQPGPPEVAHKVWQPWVVALQSQNPEEASVQVPPQGSQARQGKAKSSGSLAAKKGAAVLTRKLGELCSGLGFFSPSFLSFTHSLLPGSQSWLGGCSHRLQQPRHGPLASCCPTFPVLFPLFSLSSLGGGRGLGAKPALEPTAPAGLSIPTSPYPHSHQDHLPPSKTAQLSRGRCCERRCSASKSS